MNYKYTNSLRWLLIILIVATIGCLLFQGCSKQKPTEAPVSTVIKGTGSMSVNPADRLDHYPFSANGRNYGSLDLELAVGDSIANLKAYRIEVGSGVIAPDSMMLTSSEARLGYSYFIKANSVPYYGRITVINIGQSSQTITVQFNWVVQTEAGNRSLQ